MANNTLSTINCPHDAPRLAPIAARMLSLSLARRGAREQHVRTLQQAMTINRLTAPKSV
jgi:hypothetical protein